jgi:hypothetical protein
MDTPQAVIHTLLSPYYNGRQISDLLEFTHPHVYQDFKAGRFKNHKVNNLALLLFNIEDKIPKELYDKLYLGLKPFIPAPTRAETARFLHFMANNEFDAILFLIGELKREKQ